MGIVNIKTGKEMTRRDFIGGGIAAASMVGLAGSANASVRRGLGARMAVNFSQGEDEESMYKELLEGLLSDTLPQEADINLPLGIRRDYSFITTTCRKLTIRGCNWSSGIIKSPSYGTNNSIQELHYPDFTTIGYPSSCVQSYRGSDLYLPNLRKFENDTYSLYGYEGSHLNVHINETCANIKSYQNFPGCKYNQSKISFVGTDGRLDYNSGTGEWDFTANA